MKPSRLIKCLVLFVAATAFAARKPGGGHPAPAHHAPLAHHLARTEAHVRALDRHLRAAAERKAVEAKYARLAERARKLSRHHHRVPLLWAEFVQSVPGDIAVDGDFQAEEAEKDAEIAAAALGDNLDALWARRRQLQIERMVLWSKIAFRAVAERELSDQPLYRFELTVQPGNALDQQRMEALKAAAQFVRVVDHLANQAQEAVESNSQAVYIQWYKLLAAARLRMQDKMLLQALVALDVYKPDTDAGQLAVSAKRLVDLAQTIVDSERGLAAAENAADDEEADANRAQLQQALAETAGAVAALDKSVGKTAAAWSITGVPGTKVVVANLPDLAGAGAGTPQSAPASKPILEPLPQKSFVFEGTWSCRHSDGWKGTRTVHGDEVIDYHGTICAWKMEAGKITVTWPKGGWEHLDIDPDNPDRLTGKNNAGHSSTWIRHISVAKPKFPPQGTFSITYSPGEKHTVVSITDMSIQRRGDHGEFATYTFHREQDGSLSLSHSAGYEIWRIAPNGETIIDRWKSEADRGMPAPLHGHLEPIGAQAPAIAPSTASADQVTRFAGHKTGAIEVQCAPDGRSVLSCGRDGTIRLWDMRSGEEIRRFEGHTAPIGRLAVARTGRLFLTGSFDHTARLWDLQSPQEVSRINYGADCWAAAISPDGLLFLTADNGSAPRLRSTATAKEVAGLDAEGGYAAAWSPDGQCFATGGWNGIAHVYRVDTLKEVFGLPQRDQVYGLAFSSDNKRLLTSGPKNVVRLWNLNDGHEIIQFDSGRGNAKSLAFSPDGRFALISSKSPIVTLWDLETGKPAYHFEGHTGPISGVAFSKDGQFALSASDDGTVRVWRVPEIIRSGVAPPAPAGTGVTPGETNFPNTPAAPALVPPPGRNIFTDGPVSQPAAPPPPSGPQAPAPAQAVEAWRASDGLWVRRWTKQGSELPHNEREQLYLVVESGARVTAYSWNLPFVRENDGSLGIEGSHFFQSFTKTAGQIFVREWKTRADFLDRKEPIYVGVFEPLNAVIEPANVDWKLEDGKWTRHWTIKAPEKKTSDYDFTDSGTRLGRPSAPSVPIVREKDGSKSVDDSRFHNFKLFTRTRYGIVVREWPSRDDYHANREPTHVGWLER